ncbi:DUF1517 domain-containing protein [Synechococcus sp. YX-04-1]|uniref:DUF1517 domain-containing protein n=1 Tax=Synechococcus sp. YX-04-1 TaxID=3062778 RepID=UPI0026E3EB2A|nr:DUF1517 domain-containing protein [Synechococcus sp. YX-04-1]MDO6352416.1 DUF1517 domain-containing protein [Synechococcus sp. YX-04-1]
MGAAVATPRLLKRPQRLLASLLLPLVIVGLCLFQAQPADAARGGRMGGGSFRAPSMPRSGGSYGGGYGGGYRGGGYRGGGMGFPFLIPIFGFGGGGLFGLLILMAVAGVLVNAFRGVVNTPSIGGSAAAPAMPRNVNMIQVQVGLLASAKSLQDDLRSLASSSDTSSSAGLQRLLQETTLALLRQPDLWVYANAESGSVPFSSAESTFNRLSMNERSKLDAELTSNVGGQRMSDTSSSAGEADATNEFIVVTLLVASTASAKLAGADTGEDLRQTLRILGSTASTELMALEVIWQPEGRGDVLSANDLVTAYPNLQHL